jgi:hypothetical protein
MPLLTRTYGKNQCHDGMAQLAEMPFVHIIFPFFILNSSHKRSEVHRHKSFYTLEGQQRRYTGTR